MWRMIQLKTNISKIFHDYFTKKGFKRMLYNNAKHLIFQVSGFKDVVIRKLKLVSNVQFYFV